MFTARCDSRVDSEFHSFEVDASYMLMMQSKLQLILLITTLAIMLF